MAATITGRVFDDLNHNGVYDPGEPGIPSAYVVLRNPNGVCTTVQTNVSGIYTFTNINIAGDYTIYETAINPGATCPPTTFEQPAGFTNSSTFRTDTVTVTATNITNNQTVTAANFGHDNPDTFICSAIGYQVAIPPGGTNTEFLKISLVTGDVTVVNSNMGFNVNAIGYNILDSMIYGIENNTENLVRVAENGTVTDFGSIPNLPNGANYIVGDIDDQGHLFLYSNVLDRYYVVDVDQNSPTFGQLLDPQNGYVLDTSPYGNTLQIAISNIADWSWNSIDGYLYSITFNGNAVKIDPTTGAVTTFTTIGIPGSVFYGAMFMDASGTLYAINNDTGVIYRVTFSGTTATAEVFSQTVATSGNDGAMCANALVEIDYGDAPDPNPGNGPDDYTTLFANNGPRHQIINGLVLGTQVTSEADAYANTTTDATGDDIPKGIQDDGLAVPLTDLLTINTTYSLTVTVTNPIDTGASANLYAWIDFNQDGIFEGNEAASVQVVPTSASTQQVVLNFTVPAGITPDHTFVRLRLTTDNLVNGNAADPTLLDTRSIGAASDGEVEDYYLVIRDPLVEINKSVDKAFANVGEVLTYTVTIRNPETVAVSNVLFTDPLPSGTTYNDNLSVSTGYTGTDPQSGLTITTINPGETVTISWEVKIGDVLPTPNPIPNTGTASIDGGVPIQSNTVFTAVLENTKSVDKDFANVGDILTYTATITNPGTDPVNNVFFQDPVPAGTTYNDNLSVSTGYTGTDPQTGLTITTINPGETVTIIWQVEVVDTSANPITNIAEITIPGGTPTPTPPVETTVLENTKSVDKSFANAGETLTYTVTITNPGTSAVNNVLFQDPVPAGTTYNNNLSVSTGYTGTDPQTGLTITTINPGETVTISWEVIVIDTSVNPIINIGEITVPGGTPSPTPPAETTVIEILKAVDKTVANVGEVITYTVSITNPGPTAVSNVFFQDPIPAGTTYNDNLSVSTGYTGTDPQTGLTITTINSGQTITISWEVKIGDTVPTPNPIPNTGTVTIPNGTPTDTNTVFTAVLENTKSVDKDFANVGEVLTYTVTINNPGTQAVNNVYFIDDVPQGTIYNNNLSVSTGYTGADPQSGLTITTINPGETVTITWQVIVVDTSANLITNIGEITVPGGTPTPTSPVTTTVLEIAKAVNKVFANVGEVITYTATITNPGTEAVNNVLFTDPIPAGTTYNDSLLVNVPYTGLNPQTGLTITTINPGQTVTISWEVKIGDTAPTPNPIPNTGTVTIPNGTPTETNTVYTTVLENTKSVDKSSAVVGEILTYTVTITNPGTEAVNNVLFTDPLPTGTIYNNNLSVSTAYTGTDPQTGLTITTINPGETVTITWEVKIVDATVNPITNIAEITVPGGTPTPTPPVETTALEIAKTVNKSYADLGDIITYTVTIKNSGTAAVNNVLFTDSIPNGTTYNDNLSVNTGYTGTDPQTGLTITTINPGQTVIISWDVKVGDEIPDPNPITNVAIVTVPGGTPIPTPEIPTEINNADLVSPGNFVKSRDLAYADIGDEITYTINVTNTGNTTANNVIINDPIPNGTSYVNGSLVANVSVTGVPATGINVTNGIAPGQTVILSYKVKVDEIPNPNPIPNTASISYTYTVDPNNPNGASGGGNTNTVYTEVNHGEIPPEEAIKTVDRNPTTPGDIITYTITAKNTGNVPVTNVIVKDVVPQGTTFVDGSVVVNGLSKPSEDPNIGINVGTIDAGDTAIISFEVLVGDTAPNLLTNTADIEYSYTVDPDKPPIDNIVPTNPVDTTNLKSSIKLEKVADRTGAVVGDIVRYSIFVTNDGEIALNNIIITDPLSPGLQYADNLTINGSPSNQSILTGVNIGSLAVGAGATIAFDAEIISIPEDKFINNTASAEFDYVVSGKTFDGAGESNEETVRVYNPELTMTKMSNNPTVKVGDTFQYTITAENTGDIIINDVIVKDDLPPEFEVVQITVNGAVVNGDIGSGINIGNLAIGESVDIVLTIQVLADLTATFQNIATGTGISITDPNKPPVIVEGEGEDPGVTVYNPKLELEKSVDKSYAIVGETVTYTVVAKNTGDITLGNVELSPVTIFDILSPSLEFIAGTVTVDGIVEPLSGIATGVDIGQLLPGQSKIITFQAKVISTTINPITNTSNATFGFQLPGHTPEVGNATSNVVNVVPEVANIDVIKTADKDFVVLGDTITYTVTLKNTGTVDALNVIFKDDLPDVVELVNGSFSVNEIVINNVNIRAGVNIGIIKAGGQTIVKYTVKVVKANCELQIINSASVKFNFRLPDGRTDIVESTPTSNSSNIITIGINNFKQLSVEENLVIPIEKLDVEEISEVTGDIEIIKSHVIKTPISESNEGQNLTGYKLVIHGLLNEVVEYTALDEEQSVHSAHYSIPFSTFIVLPENYCNGNVEINGVLEDIFFKQLNCRTLFTNATILIKASVCTC
ncbi:DUF7507 domain-containing protein [Clostridium taeniosporum]|uniref:Cell surface protein n=1 Tax=Clostridium taeniosporum TaxID=394958 RepID=A0A1D7XJ17_9CLOT|nr:GEVED domain-containing protein [Clostridium taeniosporum]AOR23338.1 hypothetical protein BGI42_06140 [Clostridium taeniosporum]